MRHAKRKSVNLTSPNPYLNQSGKHRLTKLQIAFFIGQLILSGFLVYQSITDVGTIFSWPTVTAAVALLALVVFALMKFRKTSFAGSVLNKIAIILLVVANCGALMIASTLNNIAGSDTSSEEQISLTEPFIVYVSGIDTYGELSTASRSDVNILAVVNPNTNNILLVSTLRDYWVQIPGVSGEARDKLTHAGLYGIDTSIATLENLYGIEVGNYIRLNFTSLIDIVDEIGGITVYSDLAFTTSTNSGLVFDVVEGENQLNGKQALAFARERKNIAAGDVQRGKDQMKVIEAILDKVTSPSVITHVSDLLKIMSKNVETDFTSSELSKFIRYQLQTNTQWNVASMESEGTDSREYCYSYPGKKLYVFVPIEESVNEISEAINTVMNGGDLPSDDDEESSSDSDSDTTDSDSESSDTTTTE